jgi:hypothetical protein
MINIDFILIILSLVLILVGILLVSIFNIIAKKKTDKELGYGPRRLGGRGILINPIWPSEYYSNSFALLFNSIKPQYKAKVDKWIQEFESNKRKYHSYFIIGWLFFIIGIIITFSSFLLIMR